MSVRLMSAVFERYPAGAGEMLLALALADHAHDDGTHIFPSVEQLAEKTRQSVRSVQYQLRRMEESGWLILMNAGNGGRSQYREYRISPDWINGAETAPIKKDAEIAPMQNGANDDGKGANDDVKRCNPRQKRVQGLAPAYNRHRTTNESSGTKARKRAPDPGFDPLGVVLPDWLDADDWARWCRHRKALRRPLTEDAVRLQLLELDKLRQRGVSPASVIDYSIGNGWTGLFAPKGAVVPQSRADRNAEWSRGMDEAIATARAGGRPMKDMGAADVTRNH